MESDELVEQFRLDGYLIVPELLSKLELETVRSQLEPHFGPFGRNPFEGEHPSASTHCSPRRRRSPGSSFPRQARPWPGNDDHSLRSRPDTMKELR